MADKKGKKRKGLLGLSRWQLAFGVFWLLFMWIAEFPGVLLFQGLEHRWADQMYVKRGMIPPKSKAFLVKIDDDSIDAIGQYPWPRHVYAQLIDKLDKLGVKTIAFDVMFGDKSPSAKDDEAFAEAVKRSKRVVLAVDLEDTIDGVVAHFPIPALRKASAGMGYVNMPYIGSDGQVRLVPTRRNSLQGTVPLLSLAALAQYQGKTPEEYYASIPEDVLINYRGERHETIAISEGVNQVIDSLSFPDISAIAILKDKLTEDQKDAIKGGLAFVGSTAKGAFDHYPSAFSSSSPGVLVHMNFVDNAIAGDFFRQPPEWMMYPLILVMLGLPFLFVTWGPLTATLCAAGVLLVWSAADYFLFKHAVRIEWATPAVAHASTFLVLLVQKAWSEAQEKRQIRNTFSQYLSPKVVAMVVNDPEKLTLGGEKRDLTIFFLDIAHFTTISEKMTPEALTQFLNQYLTALTNVILNNDGVIDKYIGDCIMAFWNAPLDQPRHRLLAALSAVECQETMDRLNDTILPPGIPERPAARIGLNSGNAVVGNMGSTLRLSYTVIGDEVNLASRLEGANKFFGSKVMASEATYKGEAEQQVAGRPLGRVKVVGKDIPIMVYELLGRKGKLPEPKAKMLEAYMDGLDHFLGRRFEKAQAGFERALELVPGDGPSKLYLKTAQDFSVVPPQADWDGVWALTAK